MDWNYDAAVELDFAEDLTYSDVAHLLDAFAATPIFSVRTKRDAWTGPMAEGPDWILLINVVLGAGGISFAKTICEELAKDTYRAVRKAICDLGRRLRQKDPKNLRNQTPLAIKIGDVLIYLGSPVHLEAGKEEWTDEWLVNQLRSAQEIVDADFDPDRRPPEAPTYEHDYHLK